MAKGVIRFPRWSPAIEVESFMESSEAARRLVAFTEAELRDSFAAGDIVRLRRLQTAHKDAATILAEHRKQTAWAEARCADGHASPGHGVAA